MENSTKIVFSTQEIINIKNLTFTYPNRQQPVFKNISLSVNTGEFVVLCGPSGCGKTTLLRQLKPMLAPHGRLSGSIEFEGMALENINQRDGASKIGFVMQNPENQIVTDKVWHELAFGLENLGFDTPTIRLRVAEMASFFGIQNWFHKNVSELSGGQKQLLALASVMALQPSLLILDEPTSQLDPIAAADFLGTVGKINRELGVTVILTEHRLEEALPLASRTVVMDKGSILFEGDPGNVGEALLREGHRMFSAMPVPMRIWAGVGSGMECPVTVRDGRRWLSKMEIKKNIPQEWENPSLDNPSIALEDIWFKYEKNGPDVVKGLNLKIYPGQLTAILGGNGTGKTTTLSLIAGLNKPYRGKIKIDGIELSKISSAKLFDKLLAVLPQNPQSLFVAKTLGEDLMEILSESSMSKQEKQRKLYNVIELCGLEKLLNSHPYDLSGGEQQKAALAKVLLLQPKILLLDEPTKGLDGEFKTIFAAILHKLTEAGVTIVMVSHDIEFCAEYARRCCLFFDGNIVTEGAPRAFFSGNSFYTSAANRMARHMLPSAIVANDVIKALGGTASLPPELPFNSGHYDFNEEKIQAIAPKSQKEKLTPARISLLGLSVVSFILTIILVLQSWDGFSSFISGGMEAVTVAENPGNIWLYTGLIIGIVIEVIVFTMSLTWKSGVKDRTEGLFAPSAKLSKRTLAAIIIIVLAIPLTIFVGTYFLDSRKYYFISLLIILESMVPFVLIFEKRKPQARELVIIAVLCAIGVAGRVAFIMVPQFKPVTAIVIIAGIAFGGEAGFLVGAVTGFVSNMFFGQGPFTPWQMFALGIIGFLAGILFKKGFLRRSRISLCIYGGLTSFIIYGGIMNTASMVISQPSPTWNMLWPYLLQGIPLDLIHASATIMFLYIAARPMLEKLDRIKEKYGLIE